MLKMERQIGGQNIPVRDVILVSERKEWGNLLADYAQLPHEDIEWKIDYDDYLQNAPQGF